MVKDAMESVYTFCKDCWVLTGQAMYMYLLDLS